MERKRNGFLSRDEEEDQYDTNGNIYINPNTTSAWSQRTDDDEGDGLDWQDPEYDQDDEA